MHKFWLGLTMLVLAACPEGNGNNTRNEVCYPGADFDYKACLDLTPARNVNDSDFDYPDPLGGSSQYARPLRFLNLRTADPATMVAPNFQLGELAQVSKGDYAVVQTHAVEHLQEIRDDLGPLRVNSGYRSPGYNDGIPNSAEFSRHTYGDAFDLDPLEAAVSLAQLDNACNNAGAGFTRVYTTHVHCDWRDDPLDDSFYGDPEGPVAAPEVTSSYRVAPIAVAESPQAWIAEIDLGVLTAPAEGWPEGEPLRQWTAYDAAGAVIDEAVSTRYAPPAQAARVEVVVGLVLTREIVLAP